MEILETGKLDDDAEPMLTGRCNRCGCKIRCSMDECRSHYDGGITFGIATCPTEGCTVAKGCVIKSTFAVYYPWQAASMPYARS